jgi:hypothetical protein
MIDLAAIRAYVEGQAPGVTVPLQLRREEWLESFFNHVNTEPAAREHQADHWLTVGEVAEKLRCDKVMVYRKAKHWNFTRRPSRKKLLISESGFNRWISRQR